MSPSNKVYFFVRTFPVLSQTFVLNQVRDLKMAGLDVHVLAVNPVDYDNEAVKSLFGDESRHKVTSIFPRTHSKRSYLFMLLGALYCAISRKRHNLIKLAYGFLSKKNFFLAKDLFCLAWFLKSQKINMDVCIAHFGNNGVVIDHLRRAGLLECKKLLTIFHGYEISRYDQLSIWGEEYGRLTGTLLPISEHWKASLVSLGAKEKCIDVVHMGVNINTFSFQNRNLDMPLQILSVARATEKKGLEYAIKAVLSCDIDCRYSIIGDGQLLPSLKAIVCGHPNAHRVNFKGACPPEAVAAELKSTDLFLLPSVEDSKGDKEGIPVSLMEAMASGVIVLSTIHSGIPELIEDGYSGFLVPERNVEAIAAKIKEISVNNNLDVIRKNAREKVEQDFNASLLTDQLVSHVLK
jgi:colanic acid/amylovoran biosynthesis glycosyltransferase